jgi:hypothetical protein
MDYTPFQQWMTGALVKTPSVFARPASKLTEYDPVMTGNVVGGEVDVTDPGQLGRGNLPTLHTDRNVRDGHLNPDLPVSETLTALIPRTTRWIGLRGGQYNPFLFTDVANDDTPDYVAQVASAQQPFGPQGAGAHEGQPFEHGPVTVDQLESGLNVRQARRLRQNSFLRALFFLPGKTLDTTGSRDERAGLPGTGREDKGEDRITDAAVAVGNSFVVPDVRRTFDQPKDAPRGTPIDEYGQPIYDKAGYRLTATALEPIPHDVLTSHAYPNYNCITETPVGNAGPGRVRAGVQYDLKSTRPSVQPHWYDTRGFDQLIAQGNLSLKGQVKPPSASRPIMTDDDVQSNDWWAAGRRYSMPPAGMSALSVMPNIDRQPPQAWDTGMYLTPNGQDDRRAAGWRLS